MTPEQSQQMIEDIASIKTLLTQLLGANGDNGRFGKLEARVTAHQSYIDQQEGSSKVVHWGITAAVAAGTAWIAKYFEGK
jgi:hypothetical protein